MIIFLLSISTVALSAQVTWTEDWEGAIAQAKKEGKDLLVNFTGSDWCSWCMKLNDEVFSKSQYVQEAEKKFIHVKLDYPQRLPQTPAMKARNRQLADTYGVEGYPTILLMDSQLRVYGKTGYQAGGAGACLTHLEGFRKDKPKLFPLLDKANTSTGAEKAKLLDQFLTSAETLGLEGYYSNLPPQIIAADANGSAGLRVKYQIRAELNTLLSTLTENSDFSKTEKDLQTLEGKAGSIPLVKQEVMYFRAMVIINGSKDTARGKKLLEEVQKIDPTSRIGKAIPQIIAQIK